MKSKKGTEGGDLILLSVVFILCILFGSIGILAVNSFDSQKKEEYKTVLQTSMYTYHFYQYMIQPLDNPRKVHFEQTLNQLISLSEYDPNGPSTAVKKSEMDELITPFIQKYVTKNICWELRINSKTLVENEDLCLLFQTHGVDSLSIPIESESENVRLFIR